MVIPFYGSTDREMFAIERAAMDRPGKVIAALDELLPRVGRVVDIGAGDGFTAEKLTTRSRLVVPIEPAAGMIDHARPLPWVRATAQALPFRTDAIDGAYATWAYFFPSFSDISAGLEEARRVVRPSGPIIIVDNAGDDAFTAMADEDHAADLDFWRARGFEIGIVETAFVFDTLEEAEKLLVFYFGEAAQPALQIDYRVAIMVSRA